MDMGTDIAGTALTALQNPALPVPATGKVAGRAGAGPNGQDKNDAAVSKAASAFESVFISQFLGSMFSGISTDGPFGGGQGEAMFRSMMIDKFADGIVAQGGFGLAASIKAQMLKMQEAA